MFKKINSAILNEYEKFWERKKLARPILNISYSAPSPGPYPICDSLEQKWLDHEYKHAAFKRAVKDTGYLAEGVPTMFVNYGPGCLAACIGADFELGRDTVWFETNPVVTDWENPPSVTFDEQSRMWQYISREQALCASDPDSLFSITDIGGVLDVVAALRGTENLLYDLYDYPDEVKAFSKEVQSAWFQMFDKQNEILRAADVPYNTWMNIPSQKTWYALQCDFSYMISPTQFEEFVLDDLADAVGRMDRSIYHLDGVGEIPHVDMILDIPGLSGIQWVAGAGEAPETDEKWFGLYKKIQDKRKNLVLLYAINENNKNEAERLVKSLDPTGLYLSFVCSSKDKAEEMLENITRWSE